MSDAHEQPWRPGRAILIGLALMPLLVAWNWHVEVVFYCFATYAAPFFNAVAILFVLTLANLLLQRLLPRWALRPGELITVYLMLSLQGALMSHNFMGILLTLLAHPYRFASPENKWASLFLDRLPDWALIDDPAVYNDFYLGNSTLWTAVHLRGWLRPALVWCPFASVLLLTMLCLNLILRRRWIEHERLSYPVLQLPLALIQQPHSLLRQRLFWAGVALSALLGLMAGIHHLLPAVPSPPVGRYSMASWFAAKPFTCLRGMRWAIYPWAIGIAFLMPLDLSVSCWLFYGLLLAQRVLGEQFGWSRAGGYPWTDDQSFGAYLAILVMGLWVGRRHFATALGSGLALWRTTDADGREYRWAVWGALAGIVWLSWFGTQVGLGWGVALLFFGVWFALAVMITRIRAEMGFPTHDMHHMNPLETFTRLASPQTFTPATLVGFTTFFWFNRVWASHPMPHQLEGYKMVADTQQAHRPLTAAMVVAALVAPWLVMLLGPHFYYHYGSESARVNQWGTQFGVQAYNQLASWLQQPRRPDPSSALATVGGFAVALAIGAVRVRLIGWPLHPLAYAIAGSWGIEQLWMPLILASGLKAAMLRFGGLPLYRRWIPFFLGLVLGDFLIGSCWNLAGIFGGFHPYDFWPGEMRGG
ncbi:MAG: hypothetical protein IT204_13235 [Fimbriimonadaceae bacterium]|nr:hypothetical protein [Fimbriimonadaceae bacterium]